MQNDILASLVASRYADDILSMSGLPIRAAGIPTTAFRIGRIPDERIEILGPGYMSRCVDSLP